MTVFFTIVTNVLLISSIVAQFLFMGSLVFEPPLLFERYIRVMAFTSGMLVVFGAKAIGVSISTLLLEGLANTRPVSVGLVGVIAPAAAGVVLAWYFKRTVDRDGENIGVRVLILVGVLSVTQFADLYAAAIASRGFRLDPALAPNVSFVVGVSIYLLLRVDPATIGDGHTQPGVDFERLKTALAKALQRRARGPSRQAPSAQRPGSAADGAPHRGGQTPPSGR